MRPVRGLIAALALLPASAFAEALPLSGSYGNVDGCLYARTGETTGSDDFFLLTAKGVTTAVSYCEIRKVLTESTTGFVVSAICQEEGNGDEELPFEMSIEQSGIDAYMLRLDEDISWGPLSLCK